MELLHYHFWQAIAQHAILQQIVSMAINIVNLDGIYATIYFSAIQL